MIKKRYPTCYKKKSTWRTQSCSDFLFFHFLLTRAGYENLKKMPLTHPQRQMGRCGHFTNPQLTQGRKKNTNQMRLHICFFLPKKKGDASSFVTFEVTRVQATSRTKPRPKGKTTGPKAGTAHMRGCANCKKHHREMLQDCHRCTCVGAYIFVT